MQPARRDELKEEEVYAGGRERRGNRRQAALSGIKKRTAPARIHPDHKSENKAALFVSSAEKSSVQWKYSDVSEVMQQLVSWFICVF